MNAFHALTNALDALAGKTISAIAIGPGSAQTLRKNLMGEHPARLPYVQANDPTPSPTERAAVRAYP